MERLRPILLAGAIVGAVAVVTFNFAASGNIPRALMLDLLFAFMCVYILLIVLFVRAFLASRKEQVVQQS